VTTSYGVRELPVTLVSNRVAAVLADTASTASYDAAGRLTDVTYRAGGSVRRQ
jgi:YD repeat-containing protein